MRIRLERQVAVLIHGVDLSQQRVGDVICLPTFDAKMLLAVGCASAIPSEGSLRSDIVAPTLRARTALSQLPR